MERAKKESLGKAAKAETAAATKQSNAFQLGITLYSFNEEFYHYKYSFQNCMEKAGALGPGTGVELVGPQMIDSWPEVSEEFERTFKSLVERYDLRPTAYGGYQDPRRVAGRVLSDDENAEYLRLQVRGAKKLGFPILRLQLWPSLLTGSGRSNILSYAEKLGVKIGHEIHAPQSFSNPDIKELFEAVHKINSPYLGIVPDCGIFSRACARPYLDKFAKMGVPTNIRDCIVELWRQRKSGEDLMAEAKALGGDDMAIMMAFEASIYFGHEDPKSLMEIMPHIIHVHGKFFGIDPKTGEEPAVRYPEIVSILKAGGFKGHMSSEYEGHHWLAGGDAYWQVKAHQAMVRKLLGQA
jgi:hypothetical protein